MAGINISIANGNLGKTAQTSDGVCGLVATGVTAGNLNAPKRITSVANAESQNITATTEPFAYKIIKEFYQEAGDGAVLYVLLYPNTVTLTTMVATGSNSAKTLLDFATGRDSISLLAVASNPASEATVPANFVRADVISAISGSTTLIANYRALFKPFRLLIGGRTDVITNVPQDLKAMSNNAACVVLGNTVNDGHAAIGLALGRLAKSPVHVNIGKVKDGALPITTAFVGTSTVEAFNVEQAAAKGYITLTTYPNRTGYYWSDDPTASLPADDFTNLKDGRVIDKAYKIAQQVYVGELNNDVTIDAATGKLEAGVCKYLEGLINNNINTLMSGEISSFKAFVDPDQNVISTGKVSLAMEIVPKGYTKTISITLGLTNPF